MLIQVNTVILETGKCYQVLNLYFLIASGIPMENNCSCSMDDDFTSSYTICIFSSSFS